MNCWIASAVLGSVNPKTQARSPCRSLYYDKISHERAVFYGMRGFWQEQMPRPVKPSAE